MGCVGVSQRFFANGNLRSDSFAAAETHARAEIEAISAGFGRQYWQEAYASSGTALALAEILEQNGMSAGASRARACCSLRKRMTAAGHVDRLRIAGLKPQRAPVLAGGFAIMLAALAELDVPRINPVGGALRLGVLHDLLGRTAHRDVRVATVERFIERYHIDRPHAQRVATMARALYEDAVARPIRRPRSGSNGPACCTRWATPSRTRASTSTARTSSTTPTCRVLRAGAASSRAPRPGLPRTSREDVGRARRRSVSHRARRAAPRRAVHHARRPIGAPRPQLRASKALRFGVSRRWLSAHPLTAHLLDKEREEWRALGYAWKPFQGMSVATGSPGS
jgi:exopolyphosphatase/guanosine-5'-triphosphate,3'-diphosphate pyrophosphatase